MRNVFLVVLLTVACVVMAYVNGQALTIIEVIGLYAGFLCMVFVVLQSRLNFIAGAVAVICNAYIASRDGVIGLALIQLYMLPMLAFGWLRWGSPSVQTSHISLQWTPAYLTVVFLFYWLAASTIEYTKVQMTPLLSAITILGFLGQVFMNEKKLEAWLIWFVVNALGVYVYTQAGNYVAMVQYMAFVSSNVIGYWVWNKEKKIA